MDLPLFDGWSIGILVGLVVIRFVISGSVGGVSHPVGPVGSCFLKNNFWMLEAVGIMDVRRSGDGRSILTKLDHLETEQKAFRQEVNEKLKKWMNGSIKWIDGWMT